MLQVHGNLNIGVSTQQLMLCWQWVHFWPSCGIKTVSVFDQIPMLVLSLLNPLQSQNLLFQIDLPQVYFLFGDFFASNPIVPVFHGPFPPPRASGPQWFVKVIREHDKFRNVVSMRAQSTHYTSQVRNKKLLDDFLPNDSINFHFCRLSPN